MGLRIADRQKQAGTAIVCPVVTDHLPTLRDLPEVNHLRMDLPKGRAAWSSAQLGADITTKVRTAVKVPRMGFCLWVFNVCLCPLRKVIGMIRP